MNQDMDASTDESSPRNPVKCSLRWKLARRHAWGSPIPEDDLVRMAPTDVGDDRAREACQELKTESYVTYRRENGYGLRNSPDEQAKLARVLRDTCGYSEIQIEATLSRFSGFDE